MLDLQAHPELVVLGHFKDTIGTAIVYALE
jgi:hypothetical protein